MILSLTYVGLLPKAEAVSPPPDGGYPGGNTAEGQDALLSLTTGTYNTATGYLSLKSNTTGSFNTATGVGALSGNTTGSVNVADGVNALLNNTTGHHNTAYGRGALSSNTTGAFNIGMGDLAGDLLTTGDHNIDIGNEGVAGESKTIRIGDQTVHGATFIAGINGVDKTSGKAVFIDTVGQLGTGDVNSLLWPKGSILQMQPGSVPPPGFTKIGTEQTKLYDTSGHPSEVMWDVYQKN